MTLSATTDAGACPAHGDGEAMAPEIFAIDASRSSWAPARTSCCWAATHACPSVAIVVTDADGRRLYP